MKSLSLTLCNFQSHRFSEMHLSGMSLAVLSGPNGAGKSSLIDAIRWCLFGTARGDANSVVTEGESLCKVEFRFGLAEDEFLVSRVRSKKGGGSTLLSFQMKNPDGSGMRGLDGKTVAETQKRIESTLHMTDALFTATACANQGNAAAFSRAKASERKQVLADILDLATWERRADAARAMGRDLATRIESLTTQAGVAEARAATVPQIEAALADSLQQTEALAILMGGYQLRLDEMQHDREQLVADREADRARRKELEEVASQLPRLKEKADTTRAQMARLNERIAAREEVAANIKKCEAAKTEVDAMEEARREADRLDRDLLVAQSRVTTAKQKHASDIAALEQTIVHGKANHAAEIKTLDQAISTATGQASVLENAPCAHPRDEATRVPFFAIYDKCPFIAQARDATDRLPGLEEERNKAAAAAPWSADAEKLESLRGSTPWASDEARVAEIASARAAIVYDGGKHSSARAQAEGLGTWQTRMGQVEAAEEALPEAKAALEAADQDYLSAATRHLNLTAELGPAKNWDALAADLERRRKAAQQEWDAADASRKTLIQEEATLRERLSAAKAASEEAAGFRDQIKQFETRSRLLAILGNPRDGAFSKGGIPALLIDQAIPALQDAANDILTALSGGQMAVELRTQRETAAKGLAETLDIIVSDQQGPRLYETFSGGEAMRVDLALRIGLSTLLAARAGAQCELFVCDETAAPLDQRGREAFVQALATVAASGRFATILCVSHCEDILDSFPVQIRVSKDESGSHCEMTHA